MAEDSIHMNVSGLGIDYYWRDKYSTSEEEKAKLEELNLQAIACYHKKIGLQTRIMKLMMEYIDRCHDGHLHCCERVALREFPYKLDLCVSLEQFDGFEKEIDRYEKSLTDESKPIFTAFGGVTIPVHPEID